MQLRNLEVGRDAQAANTRVDADALQPRLGGRDHGDACDRYDLADVQRLPFGVEHRARITNGPDEESAVGRVDPHGQALGM